MSVADMWIFDAWCEDFEHVFTGIGLYQGAEREIVKNVWRKME